MLRGTVGWLVGIGLLLLAGLHALLASKAGPLPGAAAAAYAVAAVTSLPPTGAWLVQGVFKPTTAQRQEQLQLWVVFVCSAVAVGLMALDARRAG